MYAGVFGREKPSVVSATSFRMIARQIIRYEGTLTRASSSGGAASGMSSGYPRRFHVEMYLPILSRIPLQPPIQRGLRLQIRGVLLRVGQLRPRLSRHVLGDSNLKRARGVPDPREPIQAGVGEVMLAGYRPFSHDPLHRAAILRMVAREGNRLGQHRPPFFS